MVKGFLIKEFVSFLIFFYGSYFAFSFPLLNCCQLDTTSSLPLQTNTIQSIQSGVVLYLGKEASESDCVHCMPITRGLTQQIGKKEQIVLLYPIESSISLSNSVCVSICALHLL